MQVRNIPEEAWLIGSPGVVLQSDMVRLQLLLGLAADASSHLPTAIHPLPEPFLRLPQQGIRKICPPTGGRGGRQ